MERQHPLTAAAQPADGVAWTGFTTAAPALAAEVRARFEAHPHHIIGTLRVSGAPRLSGTEVAFRDDGEVGVGMMPASQKLADVLRDPRVEIHSAPLEQDLAAGDAKLTGRLVEVPSPTEGPAGRYFRLAITNVSLVQVRGDQLLLRSWRPGQDVSTVRRR